MGVTKSDIFNKSQNHLASIFKVLGHPARVAILQYIIEQPSCICNDLVEELGLAQPTISQHLKELKNAGLIQGTIEGKSVCYCLEEENWTEMKELIFHFLEKSIFRKESCC
ncbi:ArsR/SmtB family transcription factor [Sphingobacterium hotanense]|uniref:Winged helix-turn-helix transcriptional regulator n=1 Tax=Sphingobacterium hotanense TaxID=649196 RepID=A0ABT7NKB9_9SPHI|nr:metalloregulator ArsR/SmtB family transcription factor [Sphingobacterium hotanense]MDM1047670.1 winged helix-turn-helix transcriptional regulator [Sphingobacterium hotanense]